MIVAFDGDHMNHWFAMVLFRNPEAAAVDESNDRIHRHAAGQEIRVDFDAQATALIAGQRSGQAFENGKLVSFDIYFDGSGNRDTVGEQSISRKRAHMMNR